MAYRVAAGMIGVAILAVHLQYCTSQSTGCNESDVRLVDGESEFEGRVELCMGGEWGTVCRISPLFWGPRNAEVICTQLGKSTDSPPITSFFGEGAGPILLSGVHCNGSENKLTDCETSNGLIGVNRCDHGDDVGVICQVLDPRCGSGDVRLMDGNVTSLLAGRVEVCVSGVWGTVCDDGWDQIDAEVVCRQLRSTSPYAFALVNNLEFGAGMGPILLDEVECTGSELNLTECSHLGVNVHNCDLDHIEDAAVICSVAVPACNDTDVRLVHGESPSEGVVEICFGGRWGSVCNMAWDGADAAVVCGQLGFSRKGALALALLAGQTFGQGSRPYMISQVNCNGSEEALAECQHGGVNVHSCRSFQEAGVICADDFQLEVVVTEVGNLMLTVMLQTPIPEPVRLRIKYTWVVQPDSVERNTSRTFGNMREIANEVSRSNVPFRQFRIQVALEVGRVVGPSLSSLVLHSALPAVVPIPSSELTISPAVVPIPSSELTISPAVVPIPSSELTISLSVLVPFSVLLILFISVSIPAVIFKRRKKVEKIEDYASTAIELLTRGNPLQLPPHPPLRPPPHLPRQFPRQYPSQLPTNDSTRVISENSSLNDGHSLTHLGDLKHHKGSNSVSIDTSTSKNKFATHPIPSQPSRSTTRTETSSQPSYTNRDAVHDPLTAEYRPTETGKEDTSSKDRVIKSSKGASNQDGQNATIAAGISQSWESSKLSPPERVDGTRRGSSESIKGADSGLYDELGRYERLGNVYDRIGTYETVGNIYNKPTSSAACSTPRADAPTQQETSLKDNTSERASCVNEGGQNMATIAGSVSHSWESSKQSPPVHTSGAVDSEGAKITDLVHKKTPQHHGEGHYEQLGTVYDRISTYETVGNVYDKIGTYETIKPTRFGAHPTSRTDAPTQEETASNDKAFKGVSSVNGGQSIATTAASVSHSRESSKKSPLVSGAVGSEDAKFPHKMPRLHDEGHYEQLGTVYDSVGTYETVGNVYDKICTYETINPTSSAAHPIPRTDAPTHEETSSEDKTPERVNSVNEEGQKTDTTASASGIIYSQQSSKQSPPVDASGTVHSSEGKKATDSEYKWKPQLCDESGHYEQLGTVYDRIGTYETVGSVYDKVCTYETIGNVYDNSLVPKLGFHESSV